MKNINSEIISGVAFIFLALLFIYAGLVNAVWAIILPGDYLILAIGAALIGIGIFALRKNKSIIRT